MLVAVLTNGCRRFDSSCRRLDSSCRRFGVAVLACRRFCCRRSDLSPLWPVPGCPSFVHRLYPPRMTSPWNLLIGPLGLGLLIFSSKFWAKWVLLLSHSLSRVSHSHSELRWGPSPPGTRKASNWESQSSRQSHDWWQIDIGKTTTKNWLVLSGSWAWVETPKSRRDTRLENINSLNVWIVAPFRFVQIPGPPTHASSIFKTKQASVFYLVQLIQEVLKIVQPIEL